MADSADTKTSPNLTSVALSKPISTYTLSDLLDLSLGTPECGAVNFYFNILKILLRELLQHSTTVWATRLQTCRNQKKPCKSA